MQPYNPVKRFQTEKVSSNEYPPEQIQTGLIASKLNTAYTFIPCDLKDPRNIIISATASGSVSANGIALFTTVAGWSIDSFTTLSAVTNLDAHEASIAYVIGNLVKATLTGGTEKAYLCVQAHTSTAGPDFDADYALGYWLELSTITFLKIIHTAAGSAKVANFHYSIIGQ